MKRIAIGVVTAALVGLGMTSQSCACGEGEGEGEGEGDAGEGEGEEGEGEGEEGEGEEGEGEGEEPADVDPADVVVVKNVINNFVGRAINNNVYNGWFSNASLDANTLSNCLVHQVATVLDAAAVLDIPNVRYDGSADVDGLNDVVNTPAGPDVNCRSMTNAHAGLKIPTYAYDALVGDVVDATTEVITDVPTRNAVIGAVAAAVTGDAFKASIIDETQDVAGTASLYNKYGTAVTADLDGDVNTPATSIGGRNVILTFLAGNDFFGGDGDLGGADECGGEACFVGRVLGDNTINGYFGGADGSTTNVGRLAACLQRQIAAGMGGPDVYDEANGLTAIDSALATGANDAVENCVDMAVAHADLTEDVDGDADTDGVTGITRAELDALIGHAGDTLDALGVDGADITVLAEFLNGTRGGMPGATNGTVGQICRDITTAPGADADCPAP